MGEIGELLPEGPFLTRGYLNRADATAAAFIAAPKWLKATQPAKEANLECGHGVYSRPKQRVYRTGDLVRRLDDGCLCYVGRIDSQVKIRGQRLELSEVEKHISDALQVEPEIRIRGIAVELITLKNYVSPKLVAFLCLKSPGWLDTVVLEEPGRIYGAISILYPSFCESDPIKLRSTWEKVFYRTESLRSRFFMYDGKIYQAVLYAEPLRWNFLKGEHDLDQLVALEKARRFTLGESMSWLTLVPATQSPDGLEFNLIWTIHLALVDRWSTSLIISDIEKEYLKLCQVTDEVSDGTVLGNEICSWDDSRPFFQRFVRHCIKQERSQSSKDFWKRNLEGTQEPVFPARSSSVVSQATAVLGQHITIPLKSSLVCTPATLVQAAWYLLLGIHSGGVVEPGDDIDVLTGITLNGRTPSVEGIDQIVGPTITTVPFRMLLHPN